MPIIVGVPRSGTTLLRFMLDSHPSLAIPPETGFLAALANPAAPNQIDESELFRIVTGYPPDAPAWEDFDLDKAEYQDQLCRLQPYTVSEGVRAFYRHYAYKHKKPRYGDKTPLYCEHVEGIARLLPEAHFIHIIRDGRDAALSLRGRWFSPGNDIPTLAAYWSRLIRGAREAGSRVPHYMEVRYEELVVNPQPVLHAICRFAGLEYHPAMLHYWERTPERLKEHRARRHIDGHLIVSHEQRLEQQRLTMQPLDPDRLCRWQREMTRAESAEFLRIAGDTLAELGYET
jgi:hypothetical protein